MKGKIMWAIITTVITAALVLSSCTKETPPTTTTTTTTTAAETVKLTLTKLDGTKIEKTVEKPQYGGTLTGVKNEPDSGWDEQLVGIEHASSARFAFENLLQGDWTRGPAGTEEATWWGGSGFIQYEAGALAESWEIPDPETIIFHIRKGVHFALDPNSEASRLVNGREFTADDVVFRLNQVLTDDTTENGSELGTGLWFISATATDKYTVVVKGMPDGASGIYYAFLRISDVTQMHPREVFEKYGELNDWRNVVGTGPFIITDSIDGVSVTAKRNPDYWQHDPLFPENQLPYLDGIKRLFITDPSTRYAALRTGQVDYVQDIETKDAQSLLNENPDLEYKKELFNDPYIALTMNVQHKPFDDIRVRRAMSMAIDRPTILRDYYGGEADLLSWPVVNIPDFRGAYVPLEELPASTRELYEYHPDKAKELLTEAGLADGFTFTAVMDAPNVEIAQIYKSDLAKVGITMNIDVRERPVFRSIMGSFQHEAAFWCPGLREIYEGTYLTPESSSNYAQIFDPVIVEYKKKLTAFENQANKAYLDQQAKELNLYLRSQAYFIVPPLPYVYAIWQPWVKNYYGLPSVGPSNYWGADLRAWIDEDLKK